MTQTITELFAGKKVLITGATGFIGKVLVEKLLRCCPLLSHIYLIIRSKNRKTAAERWEFITQQTIFSRVKEECPDTLNKVTVINGDLMTKGIGLSESDRKILEEEVELVFHSAASVRFNDPLTFAVFLNTRGTWEMIKLAKNIKNLLCFLYVSTTYSNSHLDVPIIEEKIYPPTQSYKTLIHLCETENPDHLALLTSKILGKHPNTYTFTKSLAEQIILDNCKELPVVIVRPSVVINSIHEPMSGWVDNLNGLLSIIAGISKGVLRVFLAKESCSLDYVAVDYVINSLIAAAWHKSILKEKTNKELTVFNCAYGNIRKATFHDVKIYGMFVAKKYPHKDVLWYPRIQLISSSALYTLSFYLFQLLPSIIVDTFLYINGSDPILVKLSRKIYNASYALQLFTSKSFVFGNTNLSSLWKSMNKEDQKIFFMHPPEDMTIKRIIAIAHLGLQKFFFNDGEENLHKNTSRLNKLYWADVFVRIIIYCLLIWSLYNISIMILQYSSQNI
ncbi:putative fatty acyl-CoA reductase CG5065 [Lycorma delicatula]|uniref:putative fatty acyl-CoA reductase CG5065 n=1 Tax=Lycorma delicatula TaxID=130591 RepID=UPI003F50FBB8